jgi:hypothetical protein
MAKTNKSSRREFLAQRRKAIAEMANKRRQQQLLRRSGISVADTSSKTTPPVSLRGAAPPTQN